MKKSNWFPQSDISPSVLVWTVDFASTSFDTALVFGKRSYSVQIIKAFLTLRHKNLFGVPVFSNCAFPPLAQQTQSEVNLFTHLRSLANGRRAAHVAGNDDESRGKKSFPKHVLLSGLKVTFFLCLD